MDHVEVAIEGQDDEEGDAGPSVEKQHEEHHFTNHAVFAAPQVVLVVIDLDGQTGHQQEISNHDVEQEDAFVLPEFEPEDEDIEDRQVERQTQHKFSHHQPGEDLVCGIIWCVAVVNYQICRRILLVGHNSAGICPVSTGAGEAAVQVVILFYAILQQ